MRENRLAQTSIFENYAEHEFGKQLKTLSNLLDDYPEILTLIEKDLIDDSLRPVGRSGLTVENVFRCLLLKQQLGVSFERLAFHLADSMSYRTFVRLPAHSMPKSMICANSVFPVYIESSRQQGSTKRILCRTYVQVGDTLISL